MGDSEASVAALQAVVAAALDDASVTVDGLRRLSGGASRETWSFDAVDKDGGLHPLILRRDPPGAPKAGMGLEAAVLRAAAAAGVPVPKLLASSDDPALVGAPFIIMERIAGETIPRRILRDEAYATARPVLAAQCGRILGQIHRIPVDEVPGLVRADPVEEWRNTLHELGEPHPAFELGLRWLEANRPATRSTVVVHGDFRNGNLIVGPEGLRSVLDWELAHLGDPMEDLGWLCVRAWRFGVDRPVGGFGDYDDLVAGYEQESGTRVDRESLRWWEALGTLRWGVMCIIQAWTHTSGFVRSVELAAIGRRVCENEWDLLNLLPSPWDGRLVVPAPAHPAEEQTAAGPHDSPSAAQLLEAVREFLEGDVMAATEGRVQFHTRVAVNVLATVGRELELGPAQAVRHVGGLARLGLADDAALAKALSSGALDDRLGEVGAFVRQTVEDKLAVANPRYFGAAAGPP